MLQSFKHDVPVVGFYYPDETAAAAVPAVLTEVRADFIAGAAIVFEPLPNDEDELLKNDNLEVVA